MTHATITCHSATLAIVEFAYDAATKDAVKALPGADFDGHAWLVPILHLPTLKGIFDTMTVAPEVVAAYHALLRRMLCDLCGHKMPKALSDKHATGIAHITANGWRPTPTPRPQFVAPVATLPEPAPMVDDPGLALWLRSVQGAVKAEERKAAMMAKRKRKLTKLEA